MGFTIPLKRLFNTKENVCSAITVLIACLIIVTPLCGFLFHCGCNWPWLGLDANCNYYQPNSEYKCPWCASMVTGALSVGISVAAGLWASTIPLRLLVGLHSAKEILIRILFGTVSFVLIAFMTAKFAALWQGYPL